MRQRAAESDVVVVNHHLLCADAAVRHSSFGEVIPDCAFVIVDEAHQLEDVATQYFGLAVSNHRCEELVCDGERACLPAQVPDAEASAALLRDLHKVRDRARPFFAELSVLPLTDGGGGGRNGDTDERSRVTAARLAPLAPAAAALLDALHRVESAIMSLKDASEETLAIARRALELRNDLAFTVKASDPDYVFFLERRGRGVFLRAAPIDVSSIVRDVLLERMRGAVFTSATMSVDDSFEYVRARLGLRGALEHRLPSEFDYATQALLYLPPRMPDPRAPSFAAAAATEILGILRHSRGRAFVLFTSYANLRQVRALVQPALDYPLLEQGAAPRSALLAQFRATPHAVLFATSSFWQGVDVAGEALSCVIVDKLPFASPGDPITAARIEAIAARGGDAFADYQVPLAILTLLQGLGRLLRHRQDRGVLAVLDPRIRTKGYGRRFLAALPPAPVTGRLSDVERFFGAH
jgi:ATP-dependent DNA helicase DinG